MIALIDRFAVFYRRHGIAGTVARLAQQSRRLFAGKTIVFYWDLRTPVRSPATLDGAVITSHNHSNIAAPDWHRIISTSPDAETRFTSRFNAGAALWTIRVDNVIAGFAWLMFGATPEASFLPLHREDAYVFDLFIFPEYRGQRLIEVLVNQLLDEIAASWVIRAYFEVKEWNRASLTATDRMNFQRIKVGTARKMKLFGRVIVHWY